MIDYIKGTVHGAVFGWFFGVALTLVALSAFGLIQ
jgi:hypothetical protein